MIRFLLYMHFLYFIAPQNLLTSTSLVSEQALDSALDFLQDGNAGEDDKEDDMFDMLHRLSLP